ncbi:MAG TPA: peptidase, partial [Pirellulaceae bacterium]|nr:peptidase [Pirellulaceae bacterium]
VTPTYTELRGLAGQQAYVWTTRVATSSIPREVLSKVLRRQVGDDIDGRQRIVALFIQAERYNDARLEVDDMVKQFPDLAALKKQMQALQQASANRLVKELELRREAGQHALALSMATDFPLDGVAAETGIKLHEIVQQYKELQQQGEQVLSLIDQHIEALPDDKQKDELVVIREEIAEDLSIHNLPRFADYLRLADDDDLKPDQKLSLAITGWFLGSNNAAENISVAISLHEVRNLIRDYLRSKLDADRAEILSKLDALEGSSPTYLAKLLAHMKPAIETEHEEGNPPGGFEIKVPGLSGEPDVTYFVQLPPEYNPYRRYPAIVTLNGALTTPVQQINWWAGDYDEKRQMRLGQASRRGCIVIAPVWTKTHQAKYEYTAREHAAVLFSLRDALSRFSIDTDRVFLSGHSMGGDAAWDISLAHPDLWAGVIPIGATVDRYTNFYWPNGKLVPLYYVAGEMDGDRFSKCAIVLDKYLTRTGYDAVVVQFQGRGHEHFHDEIQNMFSWMNLHKRAPLVTDFKCVAMRPWDNYYWWVEVENLPSKFITLPAAWPPSGGNKAETEASIKSPTSLFVNSTASRATIYLTPEMVDFEKRFNIKFNKKDYPQNLQPSSSVMLEDARTRGDRQHPFWQKVLVGK